MLIYSTLFLEPFFLWEFIDAQKKEVALFVIFPDQFPVLCDTIGGMLN